MQCSPASSVASEMTDEELDQFFASYVPLSSLPTPPPAKEHAIPVQPSEKLRLSPLPSQAARQDRPNASPEWEVYATHLANLVPTNISTLPPCSDVICGFLARANLPDEVIAFAACVLDTLSARFAITWRDTLRPDDEPEHTVQQDSFFHEDVPVRASPRLNPHLLVLAALSLAHGFLVDRLRSSRHWAVKESAGAFTVRDIEAARRAIMIDVDYGFARIRNEYVQRMLGEMRRPKTSSATMKVMSNGSASGGAKETATTATTATTTATMNTTTTTEALGKESSVSRLARRRTFSHTLSGAAVWSNGMQTPEPSP